MAHVVSVAQFYRDRGENFWKAVVRIFTFELALETKIKRINSFVFPMFVSVSPSLHTIGGREKRSCSVRQQRETHHGQVSVHFCPLLDLNAQWCLWSLMHFILACLCVCVFFRALQVPTVDYSFEDCQLSMVKGPLCLPSHSCLLEFSRLVRNLGWVSPGRRQRTSRDDDNCRAIMSYYSLKLAT